MKRHAQGHGSTLRTNSFQDPEKVFVEGMTAWAIDLKVQGYTADQIRSMLESHQCPTPIAVAVSAMFSGNSAPRVNPASASSSGQASPAAKKGSTPTRSVLRKVVGALGMAAILALIYQALPKNKATTHSTRQIASTSLAADAQPPHPVPVGAASEGLSLVEKSGSETGGGGVGQSASAPISVLQSGPPLQQPYSVLSSLAAFRTFDPSSGTGTRDRASFHGLDGVGPSDSDNGLYAVKVEARLKLPNEERTVYLLKSTPVRAQGYECHACAPIVSAVVTVQTSQGEEQLDSQLVDLGTLGAWGTYDFSEVALVELGRRHPGLIFPLSYSGMGEHTSSIEIFSVDAKSFRKLASVETGGDNSGTSQCDAQKSECENYSVSVQFLRDNKSAYYPLQLTVSGRKRNASGTVVPVSVTAVARFNGSSYVIEPASRDNTSSSPSNAVASSVGTTS
ncbi:hypothetical protein AWB71_03170 [Caballeronia peredens]|nr:hypothetical protein AWB71_03170 [Caballeronia peredens]